MKFAPSLRSATSSPLGYPAPRAKSQSNGETETEPPRLGQADAPGSEYTTPGGVAAPCHDGGGRTVRRIVRRFVLATLPLFVAGAGPAALPIANNH